MIYAMFMQKSLFNWAEWLGALSMMRLWIMLLNKRTQRFKKILSRFAFKSSNVFVRRNTAIPNRRKLHTRPKFSDHAKETLFWRRAENLKSLSFVNLSFAKCSLWCSNRNTIRHLLSIHSLFFSLSLI